MLPIEHFYVYILYSRKWDQYYIGQTQNVGDRFIRRNKGRSKFIKDASHWLLVYTRQFNS